MCASPRQQAERDLGLGQKCRLRRCEAEVERHDELAASAARPSLDDRDRDDRKRAEALRQLGESAQPLASLGVRVAPADDPLDVRVRDEEVGVGAVEDDDPWRVDARTRDAEPVEIVEHPRVEEVQRRMLDRDPGDRAAVRDPQRVEALVESAVGHGAEYTNS